MHAIIVYGELAEWSNAAVLKTVVPKGTGGSNPSLSATSKKWPPKMVESPQRGGRRSEPASEVGGSKCGSAGLERVQPILLTATF